MSRFATLSRALSTRAYRRYASLARHEDVRPRGGSSSSALRTDEVSRFAVRLVTIARDVAHVRLRDVDDVRSRDVDDVRSRDVADVRSRGDDEVRSRDGGDVRSRGNDEVRSRGSDADGVHTGGVAITQFAMLPELLREGDLVVVNDAATLPGSLRGETLRGEPFEFRLSGPIDGNRLHGVLFGAGDHRTRTEHRAAPPAVDVSDLVLLGTVTAHVVARDGRRVELQADATGDALWQALYASGAPIQYAHRPELLPLYAVQTAYAARPWAAEMPSAGRALTWDVLLGLRRRGIAVATLTHAAGLSSTGDDTLDRALPWPERYEIPERTARLVGETKARGGRVIAIGTTVVRALEASAITHGRVVAGEGIATLRLDATYKLRVIDGLVSGLHVPGESHFDLLSAFAPRERLTRALELAAAQGLSSHEMGDACLIV